MAALLLIESEGHAHEAALKIALGAQTGRLLIEALLHSALLVSASVLIAIPVALAGLRLLENMTAPADGIAVFFDARLDHQTLLAGLIAATLLIPICALPVWWASGGRTHRPFANSRIARASRWPGLVLVGQTTLAAMLSAIALYSLLGLREAKHLDWGYRTNHLLLAVFDPSQVHYDKARTKAFYDQLLQRARRLPGVTDASIAQSIPLGFTGAQKTLMLGGRKVGLWMNTVSPGHFKQMRIQLQAGREFDLSDGESSERTVIVNERMRELWPDQIAVGRSLEVEGLNREIVGIARTVKYANWNESKRPFIYLPFSQNYTPRMTLLLEVTGAPTEITRSLRGLVREAIPAERVWGAAIVIQCRGFRMNGPDGSDHGRDAINI